MRCQCRRRCGRGTRWWTWEISGMKRRGATQATCVVEVGVSLPRRISGKVILVISGQSRMMYQSLKPEPEGAISSKRSVPQGATALLTTLVPVWRTGWKRTYKDETALLTTLVPVWRLAGNEHTRQQTALLTELRPVWRTGWKRTYKRLLADLHQCTGDPFTTNSREIPAPTRSRVSRSLGIRHDQPNNGKKRS